MDRSIRTFKTASKLLFVASTATCYFGRGYAVRQEFPGGVPAGRDTDWIGFEWVERGGVLLLLSLAAAAVAFVLRLVRDYRKPVPPGRGY